ncbi:unnamed protein product [Rhodiola kirilowii]
MALQLKTMIVTLSTTLILLLLTILSGASAATKYRVGDGLWSIPPHPSFYSNWSSSCAFMVGDSLIFEFDSQYYDLIQVSGREHEDCTSSNPFRTFGVSPAVIKFVEEGVFYFTSSIGNYCLLGLRVAVTVQPAESAPIHSLEHHALSPLANMTMTENIVPSSIENEIGTTGDSGVSGVLVGCGSRCELLEVRFVNVLLIMFLFMSTS